MHQGFELVNFDKRVGISQYEFTKFTGADLYDYLKKPRGHGVSLVTDLEKVRKDTEKQARLPNAWERRDLKPPPGWKNIETPLPPMHPQTQSSLLRLMPTELIEMIFVSLIVEYHFTPWQLVTLAMTCQRCYEIGVRHINQFLAGTWCGDRIAFISEECRPTNMPARLIWTPEERVLYRLNSKKYPPTLWSILWGPHGWKRQLHSKNDVQRELECAVYGFKSRPKRTFSLLHVDISADARLWHFFRTHLYATDSEMSALTPREPSAVEVEVVLNHSKCEYVRWDTCQAIGDQLAWKNPVTKQKNMKNICTVVRPALCWSPVCPLSSEKYPLVNAVAQGCWVGDRISLRDIPKDDPMLGWKDRTTEFMAQFVELMRYYGEVNERS